MTNRNFNLLETFFPIAFPNQHTSHHCGDIVKYISFFSQVNKLPFFPVYLFDVFGSSIKFIVVVLVVRHQND